VGSVFRRNHNGQKRWVLKFRDVVGRKRQHRLKVRSRAEAERVLREVEGQVERQRLGLDEPPPPPVLFREIAERWLAERSRNTNNHASNESRLRLHLLPALGDLFLQQVTPGLISRLLAAKSKEFGDWSVFHLRKTLVAIFNWARRMRLHRGENPAAAVPKPEIQAKEVRFLEPEIIPTVLAAVPTQHQLFCAIAIYCGLRKGEVCGLKWEDLDFKRRLIWIRRSYDKQTTKTRRSRPVPIPDELLGLIALELPTRRSEFLCPRPDGGMRTKDLDASSIVRKAVRDAA
jgi:integrase